MKAWHFKGCVCKCITEVPVEYPVIIMAFTQKEKLVAMITFCLVDLITIAPTLKEFIKPFVIK